MEWSARSENCTMKINKCKGYNTSTLFDPIFGRTVTVLWIIDIEKTEYWLNRQGLNVALERRRLAAFCMDFDKWPFHIISLTKMSTLSCISHEAVHIALRWMKELRIPVDPDTEEVLCYFTQGIVHFITQCLQQTKTKLPVDQPQGHE